MLQHTSSEVIIFQLQMNLNSKIQQIIGKTKLRLRDRKTEHFKALTTNCHESVLIMFSSVTNHKIKWDHFEILATGRSDIHCEIKESVDP